VPFGKALTGNALSPSSTFRRPVITISNHIWLLRWTAHGHGLYQVPDGGCVLAFADADVLRNRRLETLKLALIIADHGGVRCDDLRRLAHCCNLGLASASRCGGKQGSPPTKVPPAITTGAAPQAPRSGTTRSSS